MGVNASDLELFAVCVSVKRSAIRVFFVASPLALGHVSPMCPPPLARKTGQVLFLAGGMKIPRRVGGPGAVRGYLCRRSQSRKVPLRGRDGGSGKWAFRVKGGAD